MEPEIVLNQLEGIGLTLSVIEGSKIKVQPKQAITEEVRRLIRQHKNALLELLNTGNSPRSSETHKTVRAAGYGCGACGCKIYQAVVTWEFIELPETEPWEYGHRPTTHWQCENCKSIYEIIGGSRGPVLIQ